MLFYLIYFFISPILFLFIHISKFFNQKIKTHLDYQYSSFKNMYSKLSKIDRKNKKVLLFHAASVGEFEQLKPILSKLNRKKYFIIQTFTSPSIFNKENDNCLFDVCCYHPYDFFWQSHSFFSKIKPIAYIITRHDVWPSHMYILNKLNIKTFYINANLHNQSIWLKPFFKMFSKTIFRNLNFCLVPSENIKNRFSKFISDKKIIVTGESRFDQIIQRKTMNKNQSFLPDYFNESFNIIFGSYDQNDESIIINSLIKAYPNGDKDLQNKNHRIILVPHEMEIDFINRMIKQLKTNSFNVNMFSSLTNANKTNILLVDKVGILADLYRYAKLAYVGSGFSDGVHSVIEPGVYGCVVSFGPNIELLEEAKYLYNNNIGYMINNKEDMLNFFNLYNENKIIDEKGLAIKKFINNQKDASSKILNFIEEKI